MREIQANARPGPRPPLLTAEKVDPMLHEGMVRLMYPAIALRRQLEKFVEGGREHVRGRLKWAVRSGVRFFPERARKFERDIRGWSILTSGGKHEVDYLIGADGATSKVRATVTRPFSSSDLYLALGYHMPELYHPGDRFGAHLAGAAALTLQQHRSDGGGAQAQERDGSLMSQGLSCHPSCA